MTYKNLCDLDNFNKIVFLLLLCIFLVVIALLMPAVRIGDGHFYFATLHSFFESGFPAITTDAQNLVLTRFGADPTVGLSSTNESGATYTFHFWFYPLVCLPAYFMLEALNLDGFKAFQLTNSFLILLACYFILFRSGFSGRVTWFLVGVFIFSVGLNYFQWTHPEIFSSSLLVMACCEFTRKGYVATVLYAALASFQNPSISLFLLPVYFVFLYELWCIYEKDLLRIIKGVLPIFFVSLLVFMPYLWNFYAFGVYNPIAASYFIDYADISIYRFLSFIFDLNQGLIVAFPGLFLIVPSVLLFVRRGFSRVDVLLLSFVLMILPVLAQQNWNPGQSIALRYVFWAVVPVLFWCAFYLDRADRRLTNFLAIFTLISQVVIFSLLGGISVLQHASYVKLKPWVGYVWAVNPSLYNPPPEIFYERVAGREFLPASSVFYKGVSGDYLKILTRNPDRINEEFCGENGVLAPVDRRATSALSVKESEHNFFYVTGRLACAYDLSGGNVTINYDDLKFLTGWSGLESWGVWSSGHFSSLKLPSILNGDDKYRIEFIGSLFSHENSFQETVRVTSEGVTKEFIFEPGTNDVILAVDVVQEDLSDIIFEFEFPDAFSPVSVGLSSDSRELAFGLRKVRIVDLSLVE